MLAHLPCAMDCQVKTNLEETEMLATKLQILLGRRLLMGCGWLRSGH